MNSFFHRLQILPVFLRALCVSAFLYREAVCNDLDSREAAEANAADMPIDGEETGWIKVSPYGTFPGSRPGRPQVFTATECNAIVAEFNSLRGRLGRLFRGVPVYIGHPDQNPELYTDHRRLGKVQRLENRADGLWAEVEWNSLGRENLQEGFWVYPSPRWDAPAGKPEFRPDRLLSVGLTNTPRIPTSEPVTNSQETQDFKTQDARQEETTTNTTTDMDRKLITDKLGLDVTATDEEIMAKLASLMEATEAAAEATEAATAATNEATAAKAEKDAIACSLAAETARCKALAADLQATREAHANALLDLALQRGTITAADRPAWLPRLTGENREAEANALAALKPVLNTSQLNPDRNRGALTDEKARRETIANAVNELMTKKGLSYHDAWTQAKRDPALKEVFAAMTTPQG